MVTATLDLIIKRTELLTAQHHIRCREKKTAPTDRKILKSKLASHLICCRRPVYVCEMDTHQSVFRWGWWLCLMWWHLHTCAAICAPAPTVTAVPPGKQQVSHGNFDEHISLSCPLKRGCKDLKIIFSCRLSRKELWKNSLTFVGIHSLYTLCFVGRG